MSKDTEKTRVQVGLEVGKLRTARVRGRGVSLKQLLRRKFQAGTVSCLFPVLLQDFIFCPAITAVVQEEVRVVKEGSEQKEVGLSGPQQEGWSQVQEEVVEEGPGIDKTELWQTNTQELISRPKLTKREFEDKLLHAERANFDRTGQNVTEGEEKDVLPGHSDVQLEGAKIERIGGFQNFDSEYPSRGIGNELKGGTELVRRERGHQAVK